MSADLREQISATLGSAYRLERELDGGGMSRVFTAEDVALGRRVVIKVLQPDSLGEISVERFKREIQLAARLSHAHIVPVLAAGEVAGIPYYTMPFVDGESLGQRIRRGGVLSVAETVSTLRDVARALRYAHERAIIHRDIKPDNVMLSGGSAVVTDFGIAKAIDESRHRTNNPTLTEVGTSLGTPIYMAPEQASGDPVDHRADLYAFGCMAYEMLTGRPPFVETSLQRLFAAHLAVTPAPILTLRPGVPPLLASLIMQCLEKHAEDRPANAGVILETLDLIVSGATISTETPAAGSGTVPLTVSSAGPFAAAGSTRVMPPSTTTGVTTRQLPAAIAWMLGSRRGLLVLLASLAGFNMLESLYDDAFGELTGIATMREGIARALLSLEGARQFQAHDLTSPIAAYAASVAYFVGFPAIMLVLGWALARRSSIGPVRTVVVAAVADYVVSLPFFLFYPVPERWSVAASSATLLSNQLSTRLIEIMRPMSALDNCFPSFHVSLMTIAIAASFAHRVTARWALAFIALAVMLSTFVLGIHWVPDIIAGVSLGLACFAFAVRFERRLAIMPPALAHMPRAAVLVVGLALSFVVPARAGAQTSLTFIAVALDADTRRADDRLRRYLEESAGVTFVSEEASEYGRVIDYLAGAKSRQRAYVARVTPYALVASELLGAQFRVLGTYVSRATSSTTYKAYFVLNRRGLAGEPALADIPRLLRQRPAPPVFAYHSEFSTSSYFLPAIFFRQNDIFDMPSSAEHTAAIRARQLGTSSSDLVKGVATGAFDIAAVWSGTKASFEQTDSLKTYLSNVYFVPLPEVLPNDLLVASAGLDSATVERVRKALAQMPPSQIATGDFVTWRHINDAPEAMEALATLRWLAHGASEPAPVDVQRAPGNRPVPDAYLLAARRGVRLAGSEFVNFDRNYHTQQDYVLTLATGNDGSVLVRSHIVGSDDDDQEFQISFSDAGGLSTRLAELLRTRVNRVRYLWPYRTTPPTILRDVSFDVQPGTRIEARMIRWLDPHRNAYSQDASVRAVVAMSDPDKIELTPTFAGAADRDGFGFNPMSNIAYRVILPREPKQPVLFRGIALTLVALFALAGVAAALSLRRDLAADAGAPA